MATKYDFVQLTQTVFGNDTGTGPNETITPADDLGPLPANTVGLIIQVQNSNSSPRWMKLRTAGKTAYVAETDYRQRSTSTYFVPLGTNDQIEIYAESNSISFFVVAALSSDDVEFFDIDAGLPTLPDTGSNWSLESTGASVPDNAEAVFWNANSSTTACGYPPNTAGALIDYGSQICLQDTATGQVYIRSSGVQPMAGYFKNGRLVQDYQNPFTLAASGVWETASVADPGQELVVISFNGASANNYFGAREPGSAHGVTAGGLGGGPTLFISPVNASGQFEAIAEINTDLFAVNAWLVPEGGGPSPTPPTFDGPDIANQTDDEDAAINLDVSGSFNDGGGVFDPGYVGSSLPPGLSVNPLTGVITGSVATPGVYVDNYVTLVTDQGSVASNFWDWTIQDTTSPALSNPQATSITENSVVPQCTSNDIDQGTAWAYVTAAGTNPDAATIKANGVAVNAPLGFPVTWPVVTGLSADTNYQISFYQEDDAGNPSNVLRVDFTTAAAPPGVTVYTVAANPPPGSLSILDGSGCGIGNQVEVPNQTDQGDDITWYTPFDGTFVIDNATGQKTFTARSRIDSGSPWTAPATFTVN